MGYTKLERFLPKNQHPQRKLLNFENWISGGLRVLKVNYFHLLSKKKYIKLKSWLNFNAIIVFINKIKNLHQFSEKNLNKRALNHIV